MGPAAHGTMIVIVVRNVAATTSFGNNIAVEVVGDDVRVRDERMRDGMRAILEQLRDDAPRISRLRLLELTAPAAPSPWTPATAPPARARRRMQAWDARAHRLA